VKLKLKIAALVAALALAALPTLHAAAKGAYYRYNFNDSLKPWASSAESSGNHALQLLFEDDPNQEASMNGYANLQSLGLDPVGTGPAPEVPLPVGAWTLASFQSYGGCASSHPTEG
jgi:hypothetical protein